MGVEAFGAPHVAGVIAHGDGRDTELREQQRRERADVAEALDDRGLAFEVEAVVLRPLGEAVDCALRSRLVTTLAAAAGDRLAGDDRALRVLLTVVHLVHVRVHDPDHDLRGGAHVRRGDVVVRPDVVAERVREAARDAHDLALAVSLRVELHAALGASERDVHERALPRHHRAQGFEVVERDRLVEAQATLVWAQQVVVLDAVALEHLHRPVIHRDGEMDDQLVLRLREHRAHVGGDSDLLGGSVEVSLNDLEELVLRFGHRTTLHPAMRQQRRAGRRLKRSSATALHRRQQRDASHRVTFDAAPRRTPRASACSAVGKDPGDVGPGGRRREHQRVAPIE